MEVGSAGGLLDALAEARARGLALADALPAFTANPAALLRLAGKGRIAVGADADLVALDAHGRARTVVIGGNIHLRDGKARVLGPFEPRDGGR
ncbi:Isoaspartyl dipeptidase [compost metagenome]